MVWSLRQVAQIYQQEAAMQQQVPARAHASAPVIPRVLPGLRGRTHSQA
jgi:hypothetical protein